MRVACSSQGKRRLSGNKLHYKGNAIYWKCKRSEFMYATINKKLVSPCKVFGGVRLTCH